MTSPFSARRLASFAVFALGLGGFVGVATASPATPRPTVAPSQQVTARSEAEQPARAGATVAGAGQQTATAPHAGPTQQPPMATLAAGAPRQVAPEADNVRAVSASRAAGPIALDGRLDDPAWSRAEVATGFVQRDPNQGQPETERTEVRVLYDDQNLYIGARMHDRDPGRIVRRLARRDDETTSDAFAVYLDPHHDHRSGVWLSVTAAGSRLDALLANDTNPDASWDGVWEAEVSSDEGGWTAEIRVPFSQLRYPRAEVQTWGLNFTRFIERANERDWWQLITREDTRLVGAFGHLTGMVGLARGRNLELMPYTTGRTELSALSAPGDPFNSGTRLFGGGGLDVKWGVSSTLTLDATVNPDFGQVEVDPAVVNLTAFETFYSERRPFFIEGAQLMRNFGRNGVVLYGRFGATYPSLWYSRRIGRSPQGYASGEYVDQPAATTVIGATKLTGRTASGWSVAAIEAVTGRESARVADGPARSRVPVEPLTNYFGARAYRDFGRRGGVGLITTAVNRSLAGEALRSLLPGQAYAAGADGHLFIDARRTWVASGSVARTYVGGSEETIGQLQRTSARYFQRPDAAHLAVDPTARSLSGWSSELTVNRTRGRLLVDGTVWAVSPGFDANAVGYSPAADRIGAHLGLILRKTEPDRWTRDRSVTFIKSYLWNFARERQSDTINLSGNLTLHNYWNVGASTSYNRAVQDDRLARGGPSIGRIPLWSVNTYVSTDRRKTVAADFNAGHSRNRVGARSWSGGGSLVFQPSSSLTVSVGAEAFRGRTVAQYVRSVSDATATATFGGRYVFADIDRVEVGLPTRVNWIFTPRMSLQLFMQPLLSVGDYWGFKELTQPRVFEFTRYGTDAGAIAFDQASGRYQVDPDAAGPAASFGFSNPDFNYRSLRVNAVYRWEWRLGSTFYVVWTQQREDSVTLGDFGLGRDSSAMLRAPATNVFMVKLAYWIGR